MDFIYQEKEFIDNFICAQLYQRAFVRSPRADGTIPVHPCCGDAKDLHQVGDLSKQSISDIWLGADMMRLRQLHINGDYLDMNACRHTCGLCTKVVGEKPKTPNLVTIESLKKNKTGTEDGKAWA